MKNKKVRYTVNSLIFIAYMIVGYHIYDVHFRPVPTIKIEYPPETLYQKLVRERYESRQHEEIETTY